MWGGRTTVNEEKRDGRMKSEHGGMQCSFQKGRHVQFEGDVMHGFLLNTGVFFDLKWSKKIF